MLCENELIPCTISISCYYLSDNSQVPGTPLAPCLCMVLVANHALHSLSACYQHVLCCQVWHIQQLIRCAQAHLVANKDVQSGFCKVRMSHGHFHAGWFCYHHKDGWSCKGRRCPQCCCSHKESHHVPWYRCNCSAYDHNANSDVPLSTAFIIKGKVSSEHISLQSMHDRF